MFQTCNDFNRLVVPAGEYIKNQRYSFHNSPDIAKPKHSLDNPAGMRIPQPFKATLGDKVPLVMQKLKKEGMSQLEIRKIVEELQNKKINKFHNRHRIGQVLENENRKLLLSPKSQSVRGSSTKPKFQERKYSDLPNVYNNQKIQMHSLREQFRKFTKEPGSNSIDDST